MHRRSPMRKNMTSSRWHEAHADADDDACQESEMISLRKPSSASSFGSDSGDEECSSGTPIRTPFAQRVLLLAPCVASWYVACGSNAIALQRFGARSASQIGSEEGTGGGPGLGGTNLSAICFVTAVQLGLGAILGWIALSCLDGGGGPGPSSWSRWWRIVFSSPARAGTCWRTRLVGMIHGLCSLLTNGGCAAYPSSSSPVAIARMAEPCVTLLFELVASWLASGFSLGVRKVASSALGGGGGGVAAAGRLRKSPIILAAAMFGAVASVAAIAHGGVLLFRSIPAPPVTSAVALAVLAVASASARNVLYRRLLLPRRGDRGQGAVAVATVEATSDDVAAPDTDELPEVHRAVLHCARMSYHAFLLNVGLWALCSTVLLSPRHGTGAIPSTSSLSWRLFLYHPLADLCSITALHFLSAVTHSVLNATRRAVGFSLALLAHHEPMNDDVVPGLRLVAFGVMCHSLVRWRCIGGGGGGGGFSVDGHPRDAKSGGGNGNVNDDGVRNGTGTAADGTSVPAARLGFALFLLVLLPLEGSYNVAFRGRVRDMTSPAAASSKSALRGEPGGRRDDGSPSPPGLGEGDALTEAGDPDSALENMLASAGSYSGGDASASAPSTTSLNDTLVVIMGNLRGGEPAWRSLYRNVLDVNGADLALQVGELDDNDKTTSIVSRAKYVWETPEYDDWGDAIDLINPDGDGSWRHFANATRGTGLLGGTAEDPTGSGAIIFMQRWYLANNIRRLGLHGRYRRFVVTRSDHYYLCVHDLDSLSGSNVWVPSGSDWGGITDRHVVCSNETILPVLDILPPVIESPDRYEELMVGPSAEGLPNPEALIKLRWKEEDILPRVRHFERVMFTCAAREDQSRWKQPDSFPGTPDGVLLKYSEEYFKSRKTCSKEEESGLEGMLYGMYYFD